MKNIPNKFYYSERKINFISQRQWEHVKYWIPCYYDDRKQFWKSFWVSPSPALMSLVIYTVCLDMVYNYVAVGACMLYLRKIARISGN